MSSISTIFRFSAGLALVTVLAGCEATRFISYPPQVRGNRVEAERLAELVPGTSTRGDVTALLGSPTMKATFDDNTWLYVSEVTRPQIASTQNVLEQQVVSVTFDAKGLVKSVQTKTEADAVPVSVVSRATKAPGTEATFMQQLLGNIGRFGPGLGGGTPASSGNY